MTETWQLIVTAGISALGSGGIVATAANFILKSRQQEIEVDHNRLKSLLDRERDLIRRNEDLLGKVTELQRQVSELQGRQKEQDDEIHRLKGELNHYKGNRVTVDSRHILESFLRVFPYPVWIHSIGDNEWLLGGAYRDRFGFNSGPLWEPVNIMAAYEESVAAAYVEFDMQVVRAQMPLAHIEQAPDSLLTPVSFDNPLRDIRVIKWPVKAGARSYIVGMIVPEGEVGGLWDRFCKPSKGGDE